MVSISSAHLDMALAAAARAADPTLLASLREELPTKLMTAFKHSQQEVKRVVVREAVGGRAVTSDPVWQRDFVVTTSQCTVALYRIVEGSSAHALLSTDERARYDEALELADEREFEDCILKCDRLAHHPTSDMLAACATALHARMMAEDAMRALAVGDLAFALCHATNGWAKVEESVELMSTSFARPTGANQSNAMTGQTQTLKHRATHEQPTVVSQTATLNTSDNEVRTAPAASCDGDGQQAAVEQPSNTVANPLTASPPPEGAGRQLAEQETMICPAIDDDDDKKEGVKGDEDLRKALEAAGFDPEESLSGKWGLCQQCGEPVEKRAMKRHKKRECPSRIVQCEVCRSVRLSYRLLQAHLDEECEQREIPCVKCTVLVPRVDMKSHVETQCRMREVTCVNQQRGCRWVGHCEGLASHEAACAYALETCMWCLEELEQYKMLGHECLHVANNATCLACFEEFGHLQQQGVSPAILLSGASRACNHVCICCSCAKCWSMKGSQCPICRAPFDQVTALPAHLCGSGGGVGGGGDGGTGVGGVSQHKGSSALSSAARGSLHEGYSCRRALPPQDSMHLGTFWFVSPLDIRFTHDTICERFRPFWKDGVMQQPSILESACQLLTQPIEPRELEVIEVVWHEDKLYVAGTYNRRLCMYRLLAIYQPHRFSLVKVRVEDKDAPRLRFKEKFTSQCCGMYVEVRPARHYVGCDRRSTQWAEATSLLEMSPEEVDDGGLSTTHPDILDFSGEAMGDELGTGAYSSSSSSGSTSPEASASETSISEFAAQWGMSTATATAVLRPLSSSERTLIMRRFRYTAGGVAPEALLRRFVYSCQQNGFWEHHWADREPTSCVVGAERQSQPPIAPPGLSDADRGIKAAGLLNGNSSSCLGLPLPTDLVGGRVQGSIYLLRRSSRFGMWGLLASSSFDGLVFFHERSFESSAAAGSICSETVVAFDIKLDEVEGLHRPAASRIVLVGSEFGVATNPQAYVNDHLSQQRQRRCPMPALDDLSGDALVAAFASHWGITVTDVRTALQFVSSEQQVLVLRRFRSSNVSTATPVGALNGFVQSCLERGFPQFHWADEFPTKIDWLQCKLYDGPRDSKSEQQLLFSEHHGERRDNDTVIEQNSASLLHMDDQQWPELGSNFAHKSSIQCTNAFPPIVNPFDFSAPIEDPTRLCLCPSTDPPLSSPWCVPLQAPSRQSDVSYPTPCVSVVGPSPSPPLSKAPPPLLPSARSHSPPSVKAPPPPTSPSVIVSLPPPPPDAPVPPPPPRLAPPIFPPPPPLEKCFKERDSDWSKTPNEFVGLRESERAFKFKEEMCTEREAMLRISLEQARKEHQQLEQFCSEREAALLTRLAEFMSASSQREDHLKLELRQARAEEAAEREAREAQSEKEQAAWTIAHEAEAAEANTLSELHELQSRAYEPLECNHTGKGRWHAGYVPAVPRLEAAKSSSEALDADPCETVSMKPVEDGHTKALELYTRTLYDRARSHGSPMLLSTLGARCPLPGELRASKLSVMAVLTRRHDLFELLNVGQPGHEAVKACEPFTAQPSAEETLKETSQCRTREHSAVRTSLYPKSQAWECSEVRATWQPKSEQKDDDFKAFCQKWGMPREAITDVLEPLTDEERKLATRRFRYVPGASRPPPEIVFKKFVISCRMNGFFPTHWADNEKNDWRYAR